MAGFQGASKGFSDSLRRPKSAGVLRAWTGSDSSGTMKKLHRMNSASSAGAMRSNWLPSAMIACLLLVWILWTIGTVVIPIEVALERSGDGRGGPVLIHHHQPLTSPKRMRSNDHAQQKSSKDTAGGSGGDRPAPRQQVHLDSAPEAQKGHPSDPVVITGINHARPKKHSFGDGNALVALSSVMAKVKAARMRVAPEGHAPLDMRRNENHETPPPPRLPIPSNGTLFLLDNATWTLPGANDPVQCVAWRQTGDCSPIGPREPHNDKACNENIPEGAAGFCEVIDRRSNPQGEVTKVMEMHCDSYPSSADSRALLSCGTAWEFADFSGRSIRFRPTPSIQMHPELLDMAMTSERGIVFCVADSMMVSAYAAINVLRSKGCALPIELWYFPDELSDESDPIITSLVQQHQVSMRPIKVNRTELCHDQGHGKCFNVKIHAVYHTSFESVLLLDTDNFALRDPTYLFDSPEFQDTGAIFWPDFWSPHNTIFNVWNISTVWELTGVPFVDMHEQESGQLLINRRRHAKALDVLMFYAIPDNILYRYGLVFGDKDLFRLAWMRAREPFHMIQQPPGWAGQQKDNNPIVGFCGNTMVQHGPAGEMLFMHRNSFKLDRLKRSRMQIWDAVVEWEGGEGTSYWTSTTAVKRRYGFAVNPCYGPPPEAQGYKRLEGPELTAVQALEESILSLAYEAAHLLP